METQTEYLRRLASDLRESGQTATAEDIEDAAETIEQTVQLKERLERIVQMYLREEEKHHAEDPQPDHIYHDLRAVDAWTQ